MKKINKEDVFIPCGFGQHVHPEKFSPTCHACMLASFVRFIDLYNKEDVEPPINSKPPKKDK